MRTSLQRALKGRPGLNPREVQGDFFHSMGIPLLRGRLFTEADTADCPTPHSSLRCFRSDFFYPKLHQQRCRHGEQP
jgi:hypothetical protein